MFAIEVEVAIEDAVCEQQLNLDETKKLIFKNLRQEELPHAADVKLVENCFIKVLVDCARVEFEDMVNKCCNDKNFVDKFTRRSDQIFTLNDLLGLYQAGSYVIQLELYSNLIEEYDLANFIANLKAYTWEKILEKSKDGNMELEVLQCLIGCFQTNVISPIVYEKLVEFKQNCASQSVTGSYLKKLMNGIKLESNSPRQLQRFLESVKSLKPDHLFLENQLLQLIGFYLKPVEIMIKHIGNRSILEIIGGIVYMSKQLPEIEYKLFNNIQKNNLIDELRFIAVHMLDIDCDLENSHWHGFNIFIMAANVNVSKNCKWDLSGLNSGKCYTKAKNGNSCVKDGEDGIDGYSGESSGNVMIIADKMLNAERLTVILNGGSGSNGQDGGDGANGTNGTGISMKELKEKFPSPVRFWGRFHNLWDVYNEICRMGQPDPNWTKENNCYAKLKLSNGQEITHSASRYISGNCYLLYKGSKGQPGGRGGLNGLGGEGAFQGECIAISRQNERFPINVQATKGCDGQNGKPGRTGEYGKNGWDVGYTDYQFWSQPIELGTNQNQCLTITYSSDSSDRVYCGYRYDACGSLMCYATIKESLLKHRKLAESEKLRTTTNERQRHHEATATRKSAMQKGVMEKNYGQYFEKEDKLVNGISQMHAEATMTFDLMQRKAKTALEEVENLKERSREKVSRYQIYEGEKEVKKITVKTRETSNTLRQQQKSQILFAIENTQNKDMNWNELFKEEFSEDELRQVENKFNIYESNQKIETVEIGRMRQKIGLAKFHKITVIDYLPANTSEIVQHYDFHSGKYLKFSNQSNSNIKKILEFEDETDRNQCIQNAFDDLRHYELSTDNLTIIKKYYDDLSSIKVGDATLKDYLESLDTGDDRTFEKTTEKLAKLRKNQNEWTNFSNRLKILEKDVKNIPQLNNHLSIVNAKVPDDNGHLLKYLIDLFNQLRSLMIANDTLAKLLELLVIDYKESQNEHVRFQQCLVLQKNFIDKNQKSMDNILKTVQFLSERPLKASWQKFHEYPNFMTTKTVKDIQEQKLNIDKKLLTKLYHIYLIKQNETIKWHKYIDNGILKICLDKIKSNTSNVCPALLELLAWKHQLNIKVYAQTDPGQFIYVRDHFNSGKQIEHVLIREDQTIEHLVIDQKFIELNIVRRTLLLKFQSERQDKKYFPFNDEEHMNDNFRIHELCKFFNDNDRDELEDRLNKLSAEYISKNSILASLLYCFTCNGCHLKASEIFLLVDTVLECWISFDQDPELFSYIILSYSQFQWIDELVLIKLENLLRRKLQEKSILRRLLKQITNYSVKLILAKKLQGSMDISIDEELFSALLNLLPYITDDTSFLEQLNLSEWSIALKKSYWQHGLTNGRLKFADENLEQCSFYLVKLESLYQSELVQHLVNELKQTIHFSAKTLLTFVHRFYAEDTELSSDILDDFGILNSNLSELYPEPEKTYSSQQLLQQCRQNLACDSKTYKHVESLMTKLGLLTSEDRNIEGLTEVILKSPHHTGVTKHLLKIKDLLRKIENGENLILKNAVEYTNRYHSSDDDHDYRPPPLVYDTCCDDEASLKRIVFAIRTETKKIKNMENRHFYMLDIVNRGIKLKRGFSLRDTQKLVVLLTLMNENNLLAQVATGEGKTLIITTLSIIKCLYGEKLDIVTSCSVLAKRDAESEPPKGNIDLYTLFDVRVGHICSEDIDQRIEVFNNCDVIYGDLSSFQRDYLLDRFYGKNILGTRTFENVIVDEVDSMLLDNGNNMLYLSHDIPNMDKLQSLYVFLWRSVNRPIKSMEDLERFYDNSIIKQSVIADLYGMVMRDEVDDDVWKILIDLKTIGEDGRLLIKLKDYSKHVKQFKSLKEKTMHRLIFLLNNIAARQRFIKIPEDLYDFVERHLDKFIDNAKNALFMSEGVDYVVDVDRTGLDPDLNPKIIIIDKNTGTDQSSSQWHEALHQLLQIKHGCKLSLMSLKAVFISNVSYLKLYRNLYGLSGTLGSTQEKKLLNELYNVDLTKISTSKPKNFFEERPMISGYKNEWINSIYTETKKKILKQRSVLIIGETIKDVDYITKHFIKCASDEANNDSNNKIYDSLKAPYVYKREHEEFTFGQGNAFLKCGKVIVATNLAGRGTDIKLEKELVEAGGLHVIVTFLPGNCRIEEQAYGRAARCGEEGSGQLIVIGKKEDGGSYSSKIFQLKDARDVDELQRLKMVTKFYDERITIEEDCFKEFKEHYENLRQQLETSDETKDIKKLLLDSFLDKWAFWLDENSQLIEDQANDSSKKELLFTKLKKFLQTISLKFNTWLDSPSQLLKLGIHYLKNKQYDKAKSYFEKILSNHSYYLAEALYYSSAITIKQANRALLKKSGSEFRKLKSDLTKAKELFEERIHDCSNDQAIIESFKKKESNISIYIEAFSDQQKSISQIYNLFINSINDILGHPVSYNALVNFELNEILAYDTFIELQRQSILTKSKCTGTYSEDILTNIAIEYGISTETLKNLCDELCKNGDIVTDQAIAKGVQLPSIEEFWSFLKEFRILTDEIEFVVVNKEKLSLIQSTTITTLVQSNEIKIDLNKLKSTELFQYPTGTPEENIFCSKMLYEKLNISEKTYLEKRGICSINRKVKINFEQIKNEHKFTKFDSLTLSDFTAVKILTDDGIMILETLSQENVGVLQETSSGRYKLKNHIDCSSLPSCYQDVVAAILNSKFAYRLAYKHLQEHFEEIQHNSEAASNSRFQIQLVSNPYQRLLFDLMDKSIIEDTHVDYEKLKYTDLKEIFDNFTLSYAQKFENLKTTENVDFIKKTLNQLSCGIEKLETPDCSFTSVEGALKAQKTLSIVEASWFSLNGMEDLIVLQEQAYSWYFWRNVFIVTSLALAQIIVGALIEIWTVGVGTYAASFFINEGISDLFFVSGCLWNGHMTMSSYWEHKKWSMAMTAVTCGIGAYLSRGTKLSRIGYKVAGPVREEGGKKVAQMVGKELAQHVTKETIAKETLKRVGCKLIEGAAYGLAQGAVDH
ncbi:unnamed protein product, partial [Rotaria sp. Silwood2]